MKHLTMDSKTKGEELKSAEAIQLTIKRKWQIALRRYVLDNNPAIAYAPYFGLPATELRNWLQIQFKEGMHWENFGKAWKLTQKVPVQLFNLLDEPELRLCWHFINLSVEEVKENSGQAAAEILGTKQYFKALFDATASPKCQEMLTKLAGIESQQAIHIDPLISYLRENQQTIKLFADFDSEDFSRLNRGGSLQEILVEKELIKKYGS